MRQLAVCWMSDIDQLLSDRCSKKSVFTRYTGTSGVLTCGLMHLSWSYDDRTEQPWQVVAEVKMTNFGKSQARDVYGRHDKKVTFKNVAGLQEEKKIFRRL
ncbi:MAG: hypothetical protein ACLVBP_03560 [Ruminococcus sp.]